MSALGGCVLCGDAVRVAELLDDYVKHKTPTWALQTRADHRGRVRKILEDPISKMAVGRVSVRDVDALVLRMRLANVGGREGAVGRRLRRCPRGARRPSSGRPGRYIVDDRHEMVGDMIGYEGESGVATITLDSPGTKNMFTAAMGEQIWDAFSRADDDDDVRVIVVTGTGPVFCGGVDLEIAVTPEEQARIAAGEFFRRFPAAVHDSPKPSICAMNGHAMGVGVTMALSFDLRIAASDARLTMPFTRLGLIAGFGGTWFLPRLIGRAKALELLYTGRAILGSEAADMGLVNAAVPSNEVLATAQAMAATIASFDPVVLEYCKRSVDESAQRALLDGLAHEFDLFTELQTALRARGRR